MSPDASAASRLGTVRVVGTGLLGTSIGLGLRAQGVRVLLSDPSPTALALARDVGAGEVDEGGAPVDLVVVAAPPDVTGRVVAAEVAAHPEATVTDVASVKAGIAASLRAQGVAPDRYVGGHPMAGRERTGPIAATADLFIGRPWVVCPGEGTESRHVDRVRDLARALGATPVTMSASDHDIAVAVVSHLPQVAASLVAARLSEAPEDAVGLAGQGLRDVTRIAGSDATLWAQILSANAGPVLDQLTRLRADLDAVIDALAALDGAGPADGARAAVARLVARGNDGHARIPGKHGTAPTRYVTVGVLIPDTPGQLGRLFADIGEAGINVEEFSLEHATGQQVGVAGVVVLPAAREALEEALLDRGWRVVG